MLGVNLMLAVAAGQLPTVVTVLLGWFRVTLVHLLHPADQWTQWCLRQ